MTCHWFYKLILVSSLSVVFNTAADRGITPGKSIKLLYVGNSLTYVNELPAIVSGFGSNDNVNITYKSVCYPDYSLEDHWNEGKAKKEIESGGYDFVIAQQGPSAMPDSRVLLIDYAAKFSEICVKNRTKLVMYMVWPSKARLFDLDNVIQSYSQAAVKSGALLAPAGLAWKNAMEADSLLTLYSSDNFHPSAQGSFLAAACIYAVITGRKNVGFIESAFNKPSSISPAQLEIMKTAIIKALEK